MKKWDQYFLNLCREVGKNSKCHSRKIGSVLVKDNIIIATGYNGPARGIPECRERLFFDDKIQRELAKRCITISSDIGEVCPRQVLGYKSGEGLEWCNAVHSEKNCLLAAARLGTSTKGATMYIDAIVSPCTQCYSACVQAGIKEIVVVQNNIYDPSLEWCIQYTGLPIREFEI